MLELEKTFLAKFIPDISQCKNKEIFDIYFPKNSYHPNLRIRKNGNRFEITKKTMIDNDPSKQLENNIPLSEDEFIGLSKADGKRVKKTRYYYNYNGRIAEIDIFQEDLYGLVLVDFEFDNEDDKNNFPLPEFCLLDITGIEVIAGGMLCGRKYQDIESQLNELGYKKLEY
jgi:CYTH domain-containing protein